MAVDRDEMYMWLPDHSTTLLQMRDYALRTVTQPALTVLIPRRNIKVPHAKSKKLQQIQSKPRKPNASPSLLMIAPPSDPRYHTWLKSEITTLPTTMLSYDRGYPRQKRGRQVPTTPSPTPNKLPQSRLMGQRWFDEQMALGKGPSPDYFKQLSTFASMAWTDSSQATENLRKIYRQTSLLTRDPFSLMTQYPSPYITSSSVLSEIQASQEFSTINQQEAIEQAQTYFQPIETDNWSVPSVLCACAVCSTARRAKSKSLLQTRNDYLSKIMTPQINTCASQTKLVDNHRTCQPILSYQEMARPKRARSPEMTSVQPPTKLYKHSDSYAIRQESLDRQANDKLAFRAQFVRKMMPCEQRKTFFQPFVQLEKMADDNRSIIKPSFENNCFVNSQVMNGNMGLFNRFNFLQPQILNALQ